MGGSIDIEQKGWESIIHDHDHDLLVTKGMCQDLQGIVTGVTLAVGVQSTRITVMS